MNNWKSIAVLPKKEGYYLCTYIFDNHRFYRDVWFNIEKREFSTTDNITHWMEIPRLHDIK